VVCELDLKGAVFKHFDRTGASDVVHLVEAFPGEEHHGAAVFEVETGLHGTEDDLAPAIGADGERGGSDQVEMGAIPYIGLDDPPAADDLLVGHLDLPPFGLNERR
jgi:hypothetical protein